VNGASYYSIFRSDSLYGVYSDLNIGVPITSYSDRGLSAGTYYYKVAAYREGSPTSPREDMSQLSDYASATIGGPNTPVITIPNQPGSLIVIEGSISDYLYVGATVTGGAVPAYQWYSSTSNSNTGGTIISGAINEYFDIPASLTEGAYYYFCEVSATGVAPVRSDVATVTVRPIPTGPVSRISLTGLPWAHDFITIRLYTGGTGIGGGYPQYSGFVAIAEARIFFGSATDCLLLDSLSASGDFISIPADEYYITIHVEGISGWWGARKKVNIAYPIEYDSANFWKVQ
jgi:hypothetical protein